MAPRGSGHRLFQRLDPDALVAERCVHQPAIGAVLLDDRFRRDARRVAAGGVPTAQSRCSGLKVLVGLLEYALAAHLQAAARRRFHADARNNRRSEVVSNSCDQTEVDP
jgi:hypothetical protein